MLKILPYKIGSKSAKALAYALSCKRIIPDGTYNPGRRVVIINWGNSSPHFDCGRVRRIVNRPEAVTTASNKLLTFQRFQQQGVSCPDFATDVSVARNWQEDGYRVVVRHELRGHSGRGIQICQPEDELPYAPLYTRYTKKDREWRVHVSNGHVIDWSEKTQRVGVPPNNTLIRNHANGWVFCREGRVLPDLGKSLCVKGVQALGLDFGAVDLISRDNSFWLLEINSAPGLEGSTIQAYAREFAQYANRR